MAKHQCEFEPSISDFCGAVSTLLPGYADGMSFDPYANAGDAIAKARDRCLLAILARVERMAKADVIDEALMRKINS